MSAPKPDSERRRPASAEEAAARLTEIVEAAERAAAKVIDDAEEQGRRIVEEARERADGLVSARLRELADEIDAREAPRIEVGERGERRETEAEAEDEFGDGGTRPAAPRLRPVDDDPAATAGDASPRPGASAARLLATQMAISGAGRAEIEEKLRSGFEIENPAPILDAILGPEE